MSSLAEVAPMSDSGDAFRLARAGSLQERRGGGPAGDDATDPPDAAFPGNTDINERSAAIAAAAWREAGEDATGLDLDAAADQRAGAASGRTLVDLAPLITLRLLAGVRVAEREHISAGPATDAALTAGAAARPASPPPIRAPGPLAVPVPVLPRPPKAGPSPRSRGQHHTPRPEVMRPSILDPTPTEQEAGRSQQAAEDTAPGAEADQGFREGIETGSVHMGLLECHHPQCTRTLVIDLIRASLVKPIECRVRSPRLESLSLDRNTKQPRTIVPGPRPP